MIQAISSQQLLNAWECGWGLAHVERSLVLFALARPGETTESLARVLIGTRDRWLLRLRGALFGDQFESVVPCPRCAAQSELHFMIDQILLPENTNETSEPLVTTIGDRRISFRLPNSEDLLAVGMTAEASRRRFELVRRCILAEDRDRVVLDDAAFKAISGSMEREDPQADIRIAVACAACRQEWSVPFDIVTYLWNEVDAWARRLLGEVHLLASAYGWTEQEVVALSPWRRRIYLDMVRR